MDNEKKGKGIKGENTCWNRLIARSLARTYKSLF